MQICRQLTNPVRGSQVLILLILAFAISGCGRVEQFLPPGPALPTLIPEEALPTVIHLTAQANSAAHPAAATPTAAPTQTPVPSTPAPTTAQPSTAQSLTPVPQAASSEPAETVVNGLDQGLSSTPELTNTPWPEIPNAAIEIRNLGAMSRVTSPIPVYAYLQPGDGGKVRLELYGEDGRLLTRLVKTYSSIAPGARVVLLLELEFEIPLTAEVGRLVLSVADEYGRITALNSVPLLLLSIGENDLIPPVDVLAPVVVVEPARMSRVRGGVLQAQGVARTGTDGRLLARLISAQGQELGMRVFNVGELDARGYGPFQVDVPYNIERITPAIFVITAGNAGLNDIVHLTSVEVLLSP